MTGLDFGISRQLRELRLEQELAAAQQKDAAKQEKQGKLSKKEIGALLRGGAPKNTSKQEVLGSQFETGPQSLKVFERFVKEEEKTQDTALQDALSFQRDEELHRNELRKQEMVLQQNALTNAGKQKQVEGAELKNRLELAKGQAEGIVPQLNDFPQPQGPAPENLTELLATQNEPDVLNQQDRATNLAAQMTADILAEGLNEKTLGRSPIGRAGTVAGLGFNILGGILDHLIPDSLGLGESSILNSSIGTDIFGGRLSKPEQLRILGNAAAQFGPIASQKLRSAVDREQNALNAEIKLQQLALDHISEKRLGRVVTEQDRKTAESVIIGVERTLVAAKPDLFEGSAQINKLFQVLRTRVGVESDSSLSREQKDARMADLNAIQIEKFQEFVENGGDASQIREFIDAGQEITDAPIFEDGILPKTDREQLQRIALNQYAEQLKFLDAQFKEFVESNPEVRLALKAAKDKKSKGLTEFQKTGVGQAVDVFKLGLSGQLGPAQPVFDVLQILTNSPFKGAVKVGK